MNLQSFLSGSGRTPDQQLALFALLNLGLVESLASGVLSATDALRMLFTAENCLFVLRQLREKMADVVMSHGAQLARAKVNFFVPIFVGVFEKVIRVIDGF